MRYLFIFCLFYNFVSAQDMIGEYWRINEVIGSDTENIQEYTLKKVDKTIGRRSIYGTLIIFEKDNTYRSFYSAFCGNDCFPSSHGTYTRIDVNHINLYLKEFNQSGDCTEIHREVNERLGDYHIVKISDHIIKLIKSNGDQKQELLNQQYSLLIDKYYEVNPNNKTSNLLKYKPTTTTNTERVREYMQNKLNITDYKILYTVKLERQYLINLVEVDGIENNYIYVITNYANNYEYKVGSFKLEE